MRGIRTSSKIRSGGSRATCSRASDPELAPSTLYPRGASTASMRRMSAGVSSTTRTTGGRGGLPMLAHRHTGTSHSVGKGTNVDGLEDVVVKARLKQLLAIGSHPERCDGNDWRRAGARLSTQTRQG